ncbi:uncharacterized protein F4822DRAFT_305134 [Hypoxylon trugodes]|uniref:uncharacterized protein n=1 Tax=Hypoxylon trugodes TaxID=326681 RepID=UPI00219D2765|nr:uncharacterized protein F4822DRAFT_305134 [Hypoxylon trugodes]KAI1386088.1 hypothetical protein F4822DRAFT_305134 [Hypoxylon trugodes]
MANRVVPKMAEVTPGAIVNIVLKADQRTGREVSGTVRDVLTRGDHYRGIKVRLTDGRIGRVQSMASVSSASSSSPGNTTFRPPLDDQSLADSELVNSVNNNVSHPRGRRPRYRDARLEEPLAVAPEQADLSAYIVPAKRKGKGRNGTKGSSQTDGSARGQQASGSNDLDSTVADVTSATATCPVCGEFEGDETAVAHHVATHFE